MRKNTVSNSVAKATILVRIIIILRTGSSHLLGYYISYAAIGHEKWSPHRFLSTCWFTAACPPLLSPPVAFCLNPACTCRPLCPDRYSSSSNSWSLRTIAHRNLRHNQICYCTPQMTCPGWCMTVYPPTVKEKILSSFWSRTLLLPWCRAEQRCANNPRGKVRVNKVNKVTALWNILCYRPDHIGRKINGKNLQLTGMQVVAADGRSTEFGSARDFYLLKGSFSSPQNWRKTEPGGTTCNQGGRQGHTVWWLCWSKPLFSSQWRLQEGEGLKGSNFIWTPESCDTSNLPLPVDQSGTSAVLAWIERETERIRHGLTWQKKKKNIQTGQISSCRRAGRTSSVRNDYDDVMENDFDP